MKSDFLKIISLFRLMPGRTLALAGILLMAAALTGTVSNAVTERLIQEALHASISMPATGEKETAPPGFDNCRFWKRS